MSHLLLICLGLGAATVLFAQEHAGTVGVRLTQDPAVKAALSAVERNEPRIIEQQVTLCEIPAPPFMETKRGEALGRPRRSARRQTPLQGDAQSSSIRPIRTKARSARYFSPSR